MTHDQSMKSTNSLGPGLSIFRMNIPRACLRLSAGWPECCPRATCWASYATSRNASAKRVETESDQRTRELVALQALGLAVCASLSLEDTSAAALGGILEAAQPDLAFLFLREGERLILREVLPPEARHRLGAIPEHRVGECICGLVVREGRPICSRDILSHRRCTWEECKQAGIRSFAALPLRSGEEVIGVIGLASVTERDFEAQRRRT